MKLSIIILSLCLQYLEIETKKISIKKSDKSCYFPDQCELVDFENWSYQSLLICKSLYSKFDEKRFNDAKHTCKEYAPKKDYFTLMVYPEERNSILNTSFDVYKIFNHIDRKELAWGFRLVLLDLNGFHVDLFSDFKFYFRQIIHFDFWMVDFSFYDNRGDLVETCDEYENWAQRKFIFKKSGFGYTVNFHKCRFRTPICPLLFNNTKFYELHINDLIKSYYKTNVIGFLNSSSRPNKPMNTSITYFTLENFYGLDIDSNLLHKKIFMRTSNFVFDGAINSIQPDLFESFRSMESIKFNPVHLLSLVRRRGIEWIKSINHGVRVNLSNDSSVKENIHLVKDIHFTIWDTNVFLYDSNQHFFYDEDFCLMKDFPFQQLVVFYLFLSFDKNKTDLSCTTLWLLQYYPVYIKFISSNRRYGYNQTLKMIVNTESMFRACEFKKRMKMCDRNGYDISNKNLNEMDFIIFLKTFLIIITPLVCVFGIISNIQVIFVVVRGRKSLKEGQYTYMAMNSGSNIVILLIQLLSLMNECHQPFGLFCSAIYRLKFAQYFKIIFVETFSSFFCLISNFTYLAFSLNRLSLIDSQNKIFEYFAKMRIKSYIAVAIFISTILSLIKAFRFRVNSFDPDEAYPFMFFRDSVDTTLHDYLKLRTLYGFVFSVDALYDLVNYNIFTLINLIFDLVLLAKIKETIKEKEEKSKNMLAFVSEEVKEKKRKENEDAMRRVILMVVLNALVNFICKIPLSFVSLNDLRLLFTKKLENLSIASLWKRETLFYSISVLCHMNDICEMFSKYAHFLYFVSLSVNVFFYYAFDLKFRLIYRQLIFNSVPPQIPTKSPKTIKN